MTEAQLLTAVLELARWHRILAYHTHDSRRSAAGFPDLVLAGGRGVIFAELKSARGRLSDGQVIWRYRLEASGQRWRLWRPVDLDTGRVQAELKAIA